MSLCPCGCAREVKPGNEFAAYGCSQRNPGAFAFHGTSKPKTRQQRGVSWWVSAKGDFYARAAAEHERMRLSKEGYPPLSVVKCDATGLDVPKKASPAERVRVEEIDEGLRA